MMTGARLGVTGRVATPPGYEPKADVVDDAQSFARETGGTIELFQDQLEAVQGVHAVYTHVWTSMGWEFAMYLRSQVFAPYRVGTDLMAAAGPDALFMHRLPARRGEEVMTCPSFCTTRSERLYITAPGCETGLGVTRGL